MTDILIPCMESVDGMREIIASTAPGNRIIASCRQVSAAKNRNACLDKATTNIVAMVDDDISGFYAGWLNDLLVPFSDPEVCMVSARLLTTDGRFAPTCSRCYDAEPEEIVVAPNDHCVMPSAAIAFRHIGLRFDERFKGSGWEDNDFCFQFLKANPRFKFIQSNRCKLVHANEQKAQSEYWTFNREYFCWKWKISL